MLLIYDAAQKKVLFEEAAARLEPVFAELIDTLGLNHLAYVVYWAKPFTPFWSIDNEETKGHRIAEALRKSGFSTDVVAPDFYKKPFFKKAYEKFIELQLERADPSYLELIILTTEHRTLLLDYSKKRTLDKETLDEKKLIMTQVKETKTMLTNLQADTKRLLESSGTIPTLFDEDNATASDL